MLISKRLSKNREQPMRGPTFDIPRHQCRLGDSEKVAESGCRGVAHTVRRPTRAADRRHRRDRIYKILPDRRAARLNEGLAAWRRRFADRIFGLTEEAALAYGELMGAAARQGLSMSAPDGMIAAIARVNGGRLATRNLSDFRTVGLDLVSPWNFQ
jgi:predicted nucleic acid-binding protein